MYATDEPIHLAKILKVGMQSENEKCLNFLFKGKPYTQPRETKHLVEGAVTNTSKYKLIDLNKDPKHGQL